MKLLIILNKNPYDGSDVTRNALRLADFALKASDSVSIFLMNDSVDLSKTFYRVIMIPTWATCFQI